MTKEEFTEILKKATGKKEPDGKGTLSQEEGRGSR